MPRPDHLTARAHAAPWNRSIQFLMKAGDKIFDLTERDPQPALGCTFKPTLELNHPDAQTLMDDLWQAGIRPTEGAGSAGAMAATKAHLEDMRTLVFMPKP